MDAKKEYETLKEFWNRFFPLDQVGKIEGKWIASEKFNSILETFIQEDSKVLDYGCGSGWGIFEAYFTKPFAYGLGIDTAENSKVYCDQVAELSGIKNVEFKVGDQSVLHQYEGYFDFAMSINTLDVVPDEILVDILSELSKSMKAGSHLLIGLNPDFTEDQLVNMIKMTKDGHYFYKDGILRANKKSVDEWKELLSGYFEVEEQFTFALVPQEEAYPRIGFLLRK